MAPVAPAAPATPVEPGVAPKTNPPAEDKKEEKKEEKEVAAPATIVVNVPAGARLTIDGVATTQTSATRVFATPALQNGREFHYTLRAEVVRDGRTVATTERVAVRAGQETRVSLTIPVASVASSR